MADEQFKVGDVVVLKSGGPDMTIQEIGRNEKVECIWFLNGQPFEKYFTANTLKKIA